MENRFKEQLRDPGEQIQAQPRDDLDQQHSNLPHSPLQITRQNRNAKAPEAFDPRMEAPAHRTQAPQSTGVHNQRVLPASSTASQQQGQAIHQAEKGSLCKEREAISLAPGHHDRDQPVTPALSTSHQESSVIVTTQDQASTSLRRKM